MSSSRWLAVSCRRRDSRARRRRLWQRVRQQQSAVKASSEVEAAAHPPKSPAKSPAPASTSQEAAQEAWIAELRERKLGRDHLLRPGWLRRRSRTVHRRRRRLRRQRHAALRRRRRAGKAAIKRCKPGELIEVPAYISPIAIVYNLPEVEALQLSPETLAKIFNQEIDNWNDPAIAKDNPGVELPDTRIVPVNRSDESGHDGELHRLPLGGRAQRLDPRSQRRLAGQGRRGRLGTSGVVEAVAAGEGAIGYADASQAGELGIAKIQVGKNFGEPSPEAAAASPRGVAGRPGTEGRQVHVRRSNSTARPNRRAIYPIILVSSLIACTKYKSADEAAVVKAYLEYAISPEGQEAAAENAGSAPLSAALTKKITPAVEAIEAG